MKKKRRREQKSKQIHNLKAKEFFYLQEKITIVGERSEPRRHGHREIRAESLGF